MAWWLQKRLLKVDFGQLIKKFSFKQYDLQKLILKASSFSSFVRTIKP